MRPTALPSLESLSSLGFEGRNLGCPGIFAGMSRTPGGVRKVCAEKSSCAFFVPYRQVVLFVFRDGGSLRSLSTPQFDSAKTKGDGGKGTEKNITTICDKRHEIYDHLRQFATFCDNFRLFVPLT